MKESKAGSILLLISGILTILVAIGSLVFSILFISISPDVSADFITIGLFLIGFVFFLASGILKFWASKLMKKPETTYKGGIVALIVGILNGGDLLSIIGGVLGIIQGEK
jgi:hypothetical protein